MKNMLRMALVALCVACCSWACDDDDAVVEEPQLSVTAHNLSGTWRLATWRGEPLAEGSFVYLELIRKDKTFKLYENLGSFAPVLRTGRYDIYEDDLLGPVVRGEYDHLAGEWANRYAVPSLTAVSMTWVVTTDPEDVSVYERCEVIPEEILSCFPAEEE